MADMQTYHEHRGSIAGKTVAWIGDGNNMCNTYIEAAIQFDFRLKVASPKATNPTPSCWHAPASVCRCCATHARQRRAST